MKETKVAGFRKKVPSLAPHFSEMLNEISHLITAKDSTSSQLHDITSTLADISLANFFQAIENILDKEKELVQLAKRSKFNKNGFFKIVLAENELLAIRLHIWCPGTHAQENLHSHRWPLVSRILTGRLSAEYWEDSLTANGTEMKEYHYKDGTTPLRFVGTTRVILDSSAVYERGSSYHLTSDQLHRVSADAKAGCSTLMVRFNNTRSWARNLMNSTDDLDVSPKSCGVDDIERALKWMTGSE